jgi:hypothetical protein
LDDSERAVEPYFGMKRGASDLSLDEKVEPRKPVPTGITELVQCEGFRCLAVRDKDGNWADTHGNPLVVLRVISDP